MVRLERLRLADDVIMAYEMSVLPVSVIADPMAVNTSLYEYLDSIQRPHARAAAHPRPQRPAAPGRAAGHPDRCRAVHHPYRLPGVRARPWS